MIGTFSISDAPKFSLKRLFEEIILPKIHELVDEGGKYEGYLPIIQGHNAGPHQDRELNAFVKVYCDEAGWKWEPQAPQMPHANNLDLAVFPCMSKRHSHLLALCGKKEPKCNEIWDCCVRVWKGLESATIARGFLHGWFILKKVVKHNGNNEFLLTKDFHIGVRENYANGPKGIYLQKYKF